MIKRLCLAPNCPCTRLPNSGYCEKHQYLQKQLDERLEKKKQDYFNNRPKSKYSELYNTNQWRLLRAQHLKNHPVCECCGTTENLQVHHDYPKNVDYSDPELFFNPNHLVTMCVSCHARETQRNIQPTSVNSYFPSSCTQYHEEWCK